jgi:uncharacterized RDD family membrane protein YckC
MTVISDGDRVKAGFWRRFLALLIDMAVVFIPLQVLVAVLFAQTNGGVQGSAFGITYSRCAEVDIPSGGLQLQPSPPAGANAAMVCSVYFFGFETARTLTVSKTTQDGYLTTSIYQVYPLSADGFPRDNVFQTNWLAVLVLLAYLAAMEWRKGSTVGKRILGVRVFDASVPERIGLPLRKAILRQVAMWLGAIPILLVLVAASFSMSETGLANASLFFAGLFVAGLAALAWITWIVISVSNKRDPIYDRLVGTSVFRT